METFFRLKVISIRVEFCSLYSSSHRWNNFCEHLTTKNRLVSWHHMREVPLHSLFVLMLLTLQLPIANTGGLVSFAFAFAGNIASLRMLKRQAPGGELLVLKVTYSLFSGH